MNTPMRPWRRHAGMLLLAAVVAGAHLALVDLVQAGAHPTDTSAALRVRLLDAAPLPAATLAAPTPSHARSQADNGKAPPAHDFDTKSRRTPARAIATAQDTSPQPASQLNQPATRPSSDKLPSSDLVTMDVAPALAGSTLDTSEGSAAMTWLAAAAEPRPPRSERRSTPSGAAESTASAPDAQPVRVPASVSLRYGMRRGPLSGDAELVWQHDGQRFSLDLSAKVPILGTIYEQHSRGQLDEAGLAPVRYTEKRIGKGERAVNFVRPEDGSPGSVAFSARSTRLPLVRGMQDRLSWMVQLAARLQAWPGELQAGQRIEMAVAGPSGDVQRWHFLVKDSSGAGEERVWRLLREADQPHETQAEVWVSARRAFFPARVRLTESQGDPLDLLVK